MIIVRPIEKKDQNIFVEFSFEATLGIRNLPRDREKLEEKIMRSEKAFSKESKGINTEEYIFVLEDLTTGRIGGTCGIFVKIQTANAYSYRIETIQTHAKHFSATKEMQILNPIKPTHNASEICSLYLQPTFRHSGQGRLLSLSRFLFIASHRERFEKKIVAEMRGYIDQRQISPFWDAVGRHFCNLSFVELMAQLDQNIISIKEIIPQYPLYMALLPKAVQEIIGKTHESTKPAMHMLINEGFVFNQEVDVLEAGPTLEVQTANIRSIRDSKKIKIELTEDPLTEEKEFILANDLLNFRACYGHLKFDPNKNMAFINQNVAEALLVKPGDSIRYVTLH